MVRHLYAVGRFIRKNSIRIFEGFYFVKDPLTLEGSATVAEMVLSLVAKFKRS
jgi:hypothetical protein